MHFSRYRHCVVNGVFLVADTLLALKWHWGGLGRFGPRTPPLLAHHFCCASSSCFTLSVATMSSMIFSENVHFLHFKVKKVNFKRSSLPSDTIAPILRYQVLPYSL